MGRASDPVERLTADIEYHDVCALDDPHSRITAGVQRAALAEILRLRAEVRRHKQAQWSREQYQRNKAALVEH